MERIPPAFTSAGPATAIHRTHRQFFVDFFFPDVSSFILIVMNVLSSFIHEIFPSDFLDRADILCG